MCGQDSGRKKGRLVVDIVPPDQSTSIGQDALARSPPRHFGPDTSFMFATGIECSNPTIGNGRVRRDQMEECGHYRRWREDLGLVRDMGIRFLRYGLPNHLVHLGSHRYDWSFADEVMAEMRRLEIQPILDLVHFGLPAWLGDFQNPELAGHIRDYAAAVSGRYPWVRHYTPVNEILVSARLSAKEGLWNEQLCDDRAFVTAIRYLTASSMLASAAIARNRPDAVIVHSESAEFIHEARLTSCAEVDLANKQRFISLDLLFGFPSCDEIMTYLLDTG
jgi:beta-glucosidase/6-phospho-beta-glucosidase/beta-galactosidase